MITNKPKPPRVDAPPLRQVPTNATGNQHGPHWRGNSPEGVQDAMNKFILRWSYKLALLTDSKTIRALVAEMHRVIYAAIAKTGVHPETDVGFGTKKQQEAWKRQHEAGPPKEYHTLYGPNGTVRNPDARPLFGGEPRRNWWR